MRHAPSYQPSYRRSLDCNDPKGAFWLVNPNIQHGASLWVWSERAGKHLGATFRFQVARKEWETATPENRRLFDGLPCCEMDGARIGGKWCGHCKEERKYNKHLIPVR